MKLGGRAVPDTIQLKHWLSLVPDTKAAQRLLISDVAKLAGNIEKEAYAQLLELSNAGIRRLMCKGTSSIIL
jgi:serine/threonine-protein kinase HipA